MKKSFLNSAWIPILSLILFAGGFAIIYLILKPAPTDILNTKVIDIFEKYSIYTGLVFGLISMILMYFLRGLKFLFGLAKYALPYSIIYLLGILPWLIFGYQLVYLEPKYTDIAKGIIGHIGTPLFYTSIGMTAIGLIWFFIALIFSFKKSK